MDDRFLEEPFKRNGVKSWVHCIDMQVPKRQKNDIFTYHYHDYVELLYGYHTDAHVWINGESLPFKTGDLVLINSNESHVVIPDGDSHYICIKVSPSILYANEEAMLELKYVIPFLIESAHQKVFTQDDLEGADIRRLMSEIMLEWNMENPAYELIIRADILKIFAAIFRYWNKNNYSLPVAEFNDTIKKALVYISENYSTVTEEDVADYCGLSYNYFSYLFRKTLGKNFKDYLLSIKLREAEKKLISTNKSITEIALSCGFSTASYFISKFIAYKKLTPCKFREYVEKMK